jgi:hypothetical protein
MPSRYVTDRVRIHCCAHARAPLRRLLLLSESGEGARVLPDSHRKKTNRDPWLIVRIYPSDFNSFRILSLSLCASSSRSGSDQRRALCLWMAARIFNVLPSSTTQTRIGDGCRGSARTAKMESTNSFLCQLLRFDAGAAAAFAGGGDPGTSSTSPLCGHCQFVQETQSTCTMVPNVSPSTRGEEKRLREPLPVTPLRRLEGRCQR